MGEVWKGILSGKIEAIVSVIDQGARLDIVSHQKLTRRLSSVRRTATPASTLPTVREINMLIEYEGG